MTPVLKKLKESEKESEAMIKDLKSKSKILKKSILHPEFI